MKGRIVLNERDLRLLEQIIKLDDLNWLVSIANQFRLLGFLVLIVSISVIPFYPRLAIASAPFPIIFFVMSWSKTAVYRLYRVIIFQHQMNGVMPSSSDK